MANKFEILISAVDKASKTIGGVQSAMEKIDKAEKKKDASQGKSASQAAKAADQIGKSFSLQAEKASKLEEAIGGTGAALGALSASAKVLLPGSALFVAGKLASDWADSGQEIGRTAANIGMSAGKLQQFRGAAQMAGVSSDSMTGALQNLGEALQDAGWGRNHAAADMLKTLNITIKHTKDGVVDTTAAVLDFSAAIAKYHDPHVQSQIMAPFGAQAILPLLREGPAAIDAYMKKVDELNVRSDAQIKKTQETARAFTGLKLAMDGVWNDSLDKVASGGKIDNLTAGIQKLRKIEGPLIAPSPTASVISYGLKMLTNHEEASSKQRTSSGKIGGLTESAAEKSAGIGGQSFSSSAPRSVRNNNPGNIEAGNFAYNHGAIGSDGRFAQFPTTDAGIGAAAALMASYGKQGINTVSGIVGKWSPKSENPNFDNDVTSMSKQDGVSPDQPLDMKDPKVLQSLLSARFNNEGKNNYTTDQLAEAIAKALAQNQKPVEVQVAPVQVHVSGLPSGATATARERVAMMTPTRVEYNTPTTVTP